MFRGLLLQKEKNYNVALNIIPCLRQNSYLLSSSLPVSTQQIQCNPSQPNQVDSILAKLLWWSVSLSMTIPASFWIYHNEDLYLLVWLVYYQFFPSLANIWFSSFLVRFCLPLLTPVNIKVCLFSHSKYVKFCIPKQNIFCFSIFCAIQKS